MSVPPDLVESSGREDLDLAQRADLLDNEVDFLDRSCPAYDRSNGRVVHDSRCVSAWLRGLAAATRDPRQVERTQTAAFLANLSRAECAALAWRRGGHEEYQRVRAAQRAVDRRGKP